MNNQDVIKLFSFFKDIENEKSKKSIRDINGYELSQNINVLCEECGEWVQIDNDGSISIEKPEFIPCPEPDKQLKAWLPENWSNREIDEIEPLTSKENARGKNEYFEDSSILKSLWEKWQPERIKWIKNCKQIHKTQRLFQKLYDKNEQIIANENAEWVIGSGMWDMGENKKHPLFLRRMSLRYHKTQQKKEKIIIETIESADMEIFHSAFSVDKINQYRDWLPLEEIHPCDFLHPKQDEKYQNIVQLFKKIKTDQNKSFDEEDCQVYLFLGRPQNVLLQVLTKICDELAEEPNNLSPVLSLSDLEENYQEEDDIFDDSYIDENKVAFSLARDNGENSDILLTKPANKEQLEIVQKMNNSQAVVVQGPPGTGKTHTIANLIGHFLSEGKNILVVAQKEKALSVLKEKIDKNLQTLCISSIGNNAQQDLEKSTQGIKDYFEEVNSKKLTNLIDKTKKERTKIENKLHEARKNLYLQRHSVCQGIVVSGQGYSVSDAAKKVANEEQLDIIKGKVNRDTFPLSSNEWKDLYASHQDITIDDEKELSQKLPQINDLMSVDDFQKNCHFLKDFSNQLQQYATWNNRISCDSAKQKITIQTLSSENIVWQYETQPLKELSDWCEKISKQEIQQWQKAIACQSREISREHWIELIRLIEETQKQRDLVNKKSFGHIIEPNVEIMLPESDFIALQTYLNKNNKIGFFASKKIKNTANAILIDGHSIQTAKESNIALENMRYWNLRQKCEKHWNNLMLPLGLSNFTQTETTAHNYIQPINDYLNWYKTVYTEISDYLQPLGLQISMLISTSLQDTSQDKTNKDFQVVYCDIPELCRILKLYEKQMAYLQQLNKVKNIVATTVHSAICRNLCFAIQNKDVSAYQNAYQAWQHVLTKQEKYKQRQELISKLEQSSPDWAKSIAHRQQTTLPENINYVKLCEIWKCKVLEQKLNEIYQHSEDEWQEIIEKQVIEYRKITAELAQHLAWWHLSKRYTCEVKQHLTAWEQIIKSIGKGTGKKAGAKRKNAKEEMKHIQGIIPVWIMTIDQALQRFDACQAQFDIVIMDEASQVPLSSALPILKMCADKAIIIGDDEQTTPESVINMDGETVSALRKKQQFSYISFESILDHNYSVFDFVKIHYPNCGLKEHFRCVPEIIWYSNRLAYENTIKPLREGSQNKLQPSFVVHCCNGKREEKNGKAINTVEAEEIALLIKSCVQQDEYKNKSFGIISLAGKEQIDVIQEKLNEYLTIEEREKYQILCGTSADFQGDERDVIFLSFVNDDNSITKITADGNNKRYSKIYNVAVSRAKNQVWLVYSFDHKLLKEDDMRRNLIDYALNAHQIMQKDIEEKYGINALSDSEFEKEVAQELKTAGYCFEQQYPVGAYRIDMVVQGDSNRIALECDGEKWHSTPEQIANDMQRQTILERLGWQFIRLRGGQYYRNKERAIEWLKDELKKYSIYPKQQQTNSNNTTNNNSELLERIKKTKDDFLYQGNIFYEENQLIKLENFSSVSGKVNEQNLSTHQELFSSTQQVEQIDNYQIPLSDISLWQEILPELQNKSNDEIQKYLCELTELDLSERDDISMLPESIGLLSNLQKLYLTGCNNLTMLPESIGRLQNLQKLDLGYCINLETLPESIGSLSNLQDLYLTGCDNLTTLPESIGLLQNLQGLYLSGCKNLETLPENIGQLQNLQGLSLCDCTNLETLPESIGSLSNLQDLYLTGCDNLTTLPESIGLLQNLQGLYLSGCKNLETLPENIGQLQNLQGLSLCDCTNLETLLENISQLQNLQELYLSGCETLETLPKNIGQLQNLQKLDLEGCTNLATLPENIGQLQNLQELNLWSCENLKMLPESISQLSHLKIVR